MLEALFTCVSIPSRLATNIPHFPRGCGLTPVSIPSRLATNQLMQDFPATQILFQFLLGWLQTLALAKQKRTLSKVSIPSRLATNRKIILSPNCFHLFQFLLGWLQTTGNIVRNVKYHQFQFLLGWLQTLLMFFIRFPTFCFNSF